jgi:Cu/Ag efflux protein CusF
MRAWKGVVLLNLALVVGVGWGYVFWGLRVARLDRELVLARAAAASGVEREWVVGGVVRAILPELDVLVITHSEITGLMAPMTMGFHAASPKIHKGISIGDEVRFTLRGVPPNVAITAIEKTK